MSPSLVTSARKRPLQKRWHEVLGVAAAVFADKGYDAATTEDITDELGLLKGSLYYYVSAKEDLLFEVINQVIDDGLKNLERARGIEGTSLDKLRVVIREQVLYLSRNLARTIVFLHEYRALSSARRKVIDTKRTAYRQGITELLEAGKSEGLVRHELDTRIAALGILGAVNWAYRWYRPNGPMTATRLADELALFLAQGFTVPGARMDAPLPIGRTRRGTA